MEKAGEHSSDSGFFGPSPQQTANESGTVLSHYPSPAAYMHTLKKQEARNLEQEL